MPDIEELYDSNHDTGDCEFSTTQKTLTTVDPLSRLLSEAGACETSDDIISVQISTD